MKNKATKKTKNIEPTEAELLAVEKARQDKNRDKLRQAHDIAAATFGTLTPSRSMVGGIFEILKNDLEDELTKADIVERVRLAKAEADRYGKADIDDVFAMFDLLFGMFSSEEAPEQLATAAAEAKKLYGAGGVEVDCETVIEVYDQIYGQDDLMEMEIDAAND